MGITLTRCACTSAKYHRISRNFFLRLFPSRRLYQCSECGSKIFGKQAEMDAANWQMTTGKFFASASGVRSSDH